MAETTKGLPKDLLCLGIFLLKLMVLIRRFRSEDFHAKECSGQPEEKTMKDDDYNEAVEHCEHLGTPQTIHGARYRHHKKQMKRKNKKGQINK